MKFGQANITKSITESISQAIKIAESNLQEIESGLNDSVEKDKQHQRASLQKQLEIKDNLLNCKDSQIIDQQDRINKLEEEKEVLSKTLNNKKNLIKEKDKEIREIMKKAKNITIAAGKSPSKEALKEKCIKHERSIENLMGRLKNIESSGAKDNPTNTKFENTVKLQIREIDSIKETLARFESREAQLKRKIPCDLKPCPGKKHCLYSHKLEYKKPQTSNKKQMLCKYFMDRGCTYTDEECQYSHSLELVAKAEASKAATGGNMYPLGQGQGYDHNSFNDTNGSNNLINQRFRNVSTGANNNLSVELVEDLRKYPENDARRTLIRNRSGEDNRAGRFNSSSGNGRGTSGRRSH